MDSILPLRTLPDWKHPQAQEFTLIAQLPRRDSNRRQGSVARHHGEVVFRADAAFAKPEIYEKSEERGVEYATLIPAYDSLERDIAELLTRPAG